MSARPSTAVTVGTGGPEPGGRGGWWLWATPLRRAVLVAAIWRIVIAAAGVADHYLVKPGPHLVGLIHKGQRPSPLTMLIDAGVRNDSFWYARIAQHGYFYSTHRLSSIGFYPLYSLAIKLVDLLLRNVYLSGMVVSTIFLLASAAMLAIWMEQHGIAARAPIAVALMLVYPFAFFLAAMYAESLFLFLTLATFVFVERARWLPASLASFLLLLTRPTGFAVVPSLLVMAARNRRWQWRAVAPVAAAVAAIAAFSLYQYLAFGTPLAYQRAKAVPPWSAGLHTTISDVLLQARPGLPSWYLAFNLAIGLIFLAFVPLVYRRLGLAYAFFAALSVLVGLGVGLPGMQRYVAVDFPVFAVAACTSRRRLLVGVMAALFYLQLLFLALFVAGIGVF